MSEPDRARSVVDLPSEQTPAPAPQEFSTLRIPSPDRHQLHQLKADLHTEGIRNLHVALDNIHNSELRRNTDAAQDAELVNAARQHRTPATLPSPQDVNDVKPAYAVWAVAQQGGTSALLPREDAQRYVRL